MGSAEEVEDPPAPAALQLRPHLGQARSRLPGTDDQLDPQVGSLHSQHLRHALHQVLGVARGAGEHPRACQRQKSQQSLGSGLGADRDRQRVHPLQCSHQREAGQVHREAEPQKYSIAGSNPDETQRSLPEQVGYLDIAPGEGVERWRTRRPRGGAQRHDLFRVGAEEFRERVSLCLEGPFLGLPVDVRCHEQGQGRQVVDAPDRGRIHACGLEAVPIERTLEAVRDLSAQLGAALLVRQEGAGKRL